MFAFACLHSFLHVLPVFVTVFYLNKDLSWIFKTFLIHVILKL